MVLFTESMAPRLTVPRTYMSASGVQSEIAIKTLAKVARHEASYRTEVNAYRHDLENKFRAIKRDQHVLRRRQDEYSHKLTEESSLDDQGNVKLPLFKRKLRRQLSKRNPKLEKLRQRNHRTREKQNGKLNIFIKTIQEKIQKDKEDVENYEDEDREGLADIDETNASRGARFRKHRHFVRFSVHREETLSPISDTGIGSDSETDSENDEEKHKKDGGIPEVHIKRPDTNENSSCNTDQDTLGRRSRKARKDCKRRTALPEKPTYESRKQEHQAKVQQVSKRYVQFLARNAEANKEKAAAQAVNPHPDPFSGVTSLLHTQARGVRLHDLNLESQDGASHLPDSRDVEIKSYASRAAKNISLRSNQASFMQLVRLQLTSGISSNLGLIDRLLHRVRRNRIASMPKLKEDDEAIEQANRVETNKGKIEDKLRTDTHTDGAGHPETHKTKKHDGVNAMESTGMRGKKKRKLGRKDTHPQNTDTAGKPVQPSVGFPRRMSHFRRWPYYAAAPVDQASGGIHGKVARTGTPQLPGIGNADVLQYDQRIEPLHDLSHAPLVMSGSARSAFLPEVSLGQRPHRGSPLSVTGQGIPSYPVTIDQYIDKKLRRERLDSASKTHAVIWREALAQIRKVHYLSDSDV